MKVKVARTAGFCMGVSRAMEMVLAEANHTGAPLYTLGPLIHNRQVLSLLRNKGVRVLEKVAPVESGRIVIRAHGIPPATRQELRRTGCRIIDATCPKVARVQGIIRAYSRKGYHSVIVGDEGHAEVIGLMGYSEGPVYVIQRPEHVDRLPAEGRFFVVAQTTQNAEQYQSVIAALRRRHPESLAFETICDATHVRQQEVRALAQTVDAMVVVGGFHSGNTQRLVQVSQECGLPAFHVETEKDLDREALSRLGTIGITAGASTPNWLLRKVIRDVQAVRGRQETTLWRWGRKTLDFLVSSNLAAAFGAFCLAYAAMRLLGIPGGYAFPILAFLYVYAMHVFNRFLDKGASAYNDPGLAAFLDRYRHPLISLAILGILTALALAFRVGPWTFGALCALSLMGAVYSVPLLPSRLAHPRRFAKLKDIPGSRNLAQSLAWTAVIGILPWLESPAVVWPKAIAAATVVLLLSFARSVLVDVFHVQGDLIVGTETLPIVLGERGALKLLGGILAASVLALLGGALWGWVSPSALLFILAVAGLGSCAVAYRRRWLLPGVGLEAWAETAFFLTGLAAWLWSPLS